MNIQKTSLVFALLLVPAFSFFGGCADGDDQVGLSGSTTGMSSSSSGSSSSSSGMVDENVTEPDGPSKLTIVNGVNDYDAIRLCFIPWPDGGDPAPFPTDAKGLAFAKASVVDMTAGFIPSGTDVYVHVIAGNLDKTANMGCAELTSGVVDPDVLVVPLAVLPASAIEAPRSLLLVPNGCLGGEGHEGNLEKTVCGKDYSINTPTPGLVAVGMSRITQDDRVSLQAVHASIATATMDVKVLPGINDAMPATLAQSLTLGAIGKNPPFREFARDNFGPLDLAQIQTFPPGNAMPSSTTIVQTALAQGAIAEADFKNGTAFTVVGVGSPPSMAAGDFWHAFTWVFVPSDP